MIKRYKNEEVILEFINYELFGCFVNFKVYYYIFSVCFIVREVN